MIKEEEFIEVFHNEQSARMYIIKGISETTTFYPRSRKEIRVCSNNNNSSGSINNSNGSINNSNVFLYLLNS